MIEVLYRLRYVIWIELFSPLFTLPAFARLGFYMVSVSDGEKMNDQLTVTGKIVSGEKKGAFFTQLDWVQQQCRNKLGFRPYSGTLNLEIDEDKVPLIDALIRNGGIKLVPPDSNFCTGYVYPVSIMGVSGALVAPAEDVRIHGKNIIELIAPINLKDALDADDGDQIMLVASYPKTDKPKLEIED